MLLKKKILQEEGNCFPSRTPGFTPFLWDPCCSPLYLFVLSYYVSLLSYFRIVMSVMLSAYKRCSGSLYIQLFIWGLMSYLRYFYLFTHSGVQHILCCVFLFCLSSYFVLCTQCCQCLWIVHSWLFLRFSLALIYKICDWSISIQLLLSRNNLMVETCFHSTWESTSLQHTSWCYHTENQYEVWCMFGTNHFNIIYAII